MLWENLQWFPAEHAEATDTEEPEGWIRNWVPPHFEYETP